MANFHSNNSNKKVTFAECISTIREYEYDKTEDVCIKKGNQWQETIDLTCREFNRPISQGGCGSDWSILECKLSQLEEPCWCMIGQLWRRLHSNSKRWEEDSDDSDKDNDSDSDSDSDDSDKDNDSDNNDSDISGSDISDSDSNDSDISDSDSNDSDSNDSDKDNKNSL